MKIFKKYKKSFSVLAVLVIAGVIYFALSTNDELGIETSRVDKRDVVKLVEETGVIRAPEDAQLSFERSGKVQSIAVSEGQNVTESQTLITLSDSSEYADYLSAQAEVGAQVATLADMRANTKEGLEANSSLQATQKQQLALVENAYRELLSDDLVARPVNKDTTVTVPTISGSYSGGEGVYTITVLPTNISGSFYLHTSGIENPDPVKIEEDNPTPLGTKGLYISFSDEIRDYSGIKWFVEIPNKKSSSYITNLNAYIAAQQSLNKSVVESEVTSEQIGSQIARVEKAQASLRRAESELSKMTLRAPFDGLVTDISIERGEIARAGEGVLSLISDSKLEIIVNIPESDVANVEVGDESIVTFDAYDDEIFEASVTFVNPRANVVDGVSTIETILQFKEVDEKIRAGLSADVEISAEKRDGVLAIPNRAIIEKSTGQKFVRALNEGSLIEIPVKTGLFGSEGMVEITSGLTEGDEIITFISEEALSNLEGQETE